MKEIPKGTWGVSYMADANLKSDNAIVKTVIDSIVKFREKDQVMFDECVTHYAIHKKLVSANNLAAIREGLAERGITLDHWFRDGIGYVNYLYLGSPSETDERLALRQPKLQETGGGATVKHDEPDKPAKKDKKKSKKKKKKGLLAQLESELDGLTAPIEEYEKHLEKVGVEVEVVLEPSILEFPDSSAISKMQRLDDGRVVVFFVERGIFMYSDMPDSLWQKFVKAKARGESIGKVWNKLVKPDTYPVGRIG